MAWKKGYLAGYLGKNEAEVSADLRFPFFAKGYRAGMEAKAIEGQPLAAVQGAVHYGLFKKLGERIEQAFEPVDKESKTKLKRELKRNKYFLLP